MFLALMAGWEEPTKGATVVCVLLACVNPKHVLLMFASHLQVLQALAMPDIVHVLSGLDTTQFVRSRIAKGQLNQQKIIAIVRAVGDAPPPLDNMECTRKLLSKIPHVGPSLSLVIVRELRLFGYFPLDEAVRLCKGKGPVKSLAFQGIVG